MPGPDEIVDDDEIERVAMQRRWPAGDRVERSEDLHDRASSPDASSSSPRQPSLLAGKLGRGRSAPG